MSEINRYIVSKGSRTTTYPDGPFVLYTDHIAALEAVKATAVRALEWVKWTNQTGWQADTVIGQYQVAWFAEMEAFQLYKPNASVSDRFTKFERSEAAKAAAQADYERRIRSAIVPSPALEANRLADKIEDLIEEFGDDPKAALDCISEWISLRHPIPASPALEANQQPKPVAWRWRDTEYQTWNYIDFDPEHMDYVFVEPLYAVPEANQQEIETLRGQVETMRKALEDIAERSHGISPAVKNIARAAITRGAER